VTSSGVRVGLVGYGMAGRTIHRPLIEAAGLSITHVVTADAARRDQASADLPDARLVPSLDALLLEAYEVDVVVLASPTGVHAEQALSCVEAGLPVVVDKPLGVDAVQARRLVESARAAGVRLTVFQNRRWDPEHLTLQRLLAEGRLGEVFRFERRWERWRPVPKDRWRENAGPREGGGLLLDLGAHLVDSAVQLFGPVREVYAELGARSTFAEDDVHLALGHENGVRSHLSALSLAGAPGPRTRVLGTSAAYVVTSFEDEPTAFGDLADLDGDHTGWLVTGPSREPVLRAPGAAVDFYRLLASALTEGGPLPVDPRDAVHVLEVLDAARVSAAERLVVRLV
jgi:predicted dehydrogenase